MKFILKFERPFFNKTSDLQETNQVGSLKPVFKTQVEIISSTNGFHIKRLDDQWGSIQGPTKKKCKNIL